MTSPPGSHTIDAPDTPPPFDAAGLQITTDVFYGEKQRQTLNIVRPDGATADAPIVVYFHGGGWRTGRKALFTYVAAAMAPGGVVTVLPSYRLYPRVKFPDFLHDCAAAVAWVQGHPEQVGHGPVFLMGHSAGAYNAMMLGLDRSWLRRAGADPKRIAGVIGLAGPYDFLPLAETKRAPIFGESAGPETQPITFACADAPPLLLVTGDQDLEIPAKEADALAKRMLEVGGKAESCVLEGVNHRDLIRGFRPGSKVQAQVLAFIKERTT